MKTNKLYFIIIVLAIVCVSLVHKNSNASNNISVEKFGSNKEVPYSLPSIEVNVIEQQNFKANEFTIQVFLEIQGKDKEKLFKQIESSRGRIFAIAKDMEISESNIQQNSVELHKEWSYKDGLREFAQYNAKQKFLITLDNKEEAVNFMQALSAETNVEIGQTIVSVKDSEKLKESIVKIAGEKALKKANLYAESVHSKVGKVLYIGSGFERNGLATNLYKSRAMGAFPDGDATAIADSVQFSVEMRLIVELKN